MSYFTKRIWDPASYQGGSVQRRYFEGWYFKQADAKMHRVFAVIPGVSFSADGTLKHAFVQVISNSGITHYFSYPIEAFEYNPRQPFNIRIGQNTFSQTGMTLELKDDTGIVQGTIKFKTLSPWPVTLFSPGVMGWYRFVPCMQTYHGVLSMDHEVSGTVMLDGEVIELDGGRGYIEKDWGRSFPSSWIWAQSNHFDTPGVSLSISVAKIPWMTGTFIGSIAGLQIDGVLHRFTTYTGTRLVCAETKAHEAHLILRDRHHELEIYIHGYPALLLKSPVLGAMEGRAAESLGGTIDVSMYKLRDGHPLLLFSDTGVLAGIEVMNENDELSISNC